MIAEKSKRKKRKLPEGEEIGLWEGKVVVLEGEDEETEVSGRTSVGSEDRRDDDARVLREADVDDDTNLLHIFALRFSGRENVLLVSLCINTRDSWVRDFAVLTCTGFWVTRVGIWFARVRMNTSIPGNLILSS